MSRSLQEWLDYQLAVHPREVELGLARIGAVARALEWPRPAREVITVAGTNGKGSTVAFAEAIARADGRRVGAYTSPHLLRYNERVRIDGRDADDAALVAAFERIEAARGEMPLTYFEFGTLAALLLFAEADLDLAVLEVGLGGRLDAVNLVDADVAVVTSVGIDHTDWLGPDRESIAREKAGVFRTGRPAVIAERDPPHTLLDEARRIGARPVRAGIDFHAASTADGWRYRDAQGALDLPRPSLAAPAQIDNAAAAIAALRSLSTPPHEHAIAAGVRGARVAARLQRFPGEVEGEVEVVVDVAHNPHAAAELSRWLRANPIRGRTLAVFAALADKDVDGIVRALEADIAAWWAAGLPDAGPRGRDAAAMTAALRDALRREVGSGETVAAALAAARSAAAPGDRVLVLGSFFTAAAALRELNSDAAP